MQPDPGPMARFEALRDDPATMGMICQRINGEPPETLKVICKALGIPLGKTFEWISEDRGRTEQYLNALRVSADSDIHETVTIADGAKPEDVSVARLRVETRFRRASKWDRGRYGDATEVKHTGSVSLVAVLSSLPRQEVDVTPRVAEPALEDKNKEVPEKNSAQKIQAQPVSAEAEAI